MIPAALCLAALLLAQSVAVPTVDSSLNNDWEQYKQVYRKVYASQYAEKIRRLIWEEHVSIIARHNREFDLGLHSYTLGLNEFADLSNDDFLSLLKTQRLALARGDNSCSKFLKPSHARLPASVDWRKKGYVTPVKNQGQLGASWAFSAVGAIEGQEFAASGKLVALSERNLMDCCRIQEGESTEERYGPVDKAFACVRKMGGIDTAESYPSLPGNGTCHFDPAHIGARVTGVVDITSGDEQALQAAVATVGPVSVLVDASHVSFQLYRSGVYDEPACSAEMLDHAMLIVGYGSLNGDDYWIVKNSWGSSWGMEGYIEMSRNKQNQCGIASQAVYPQVM